MHGTHHRDVLADVHARVQRLREEAAAARLFRPALTRRIVAASLRRAANVLDPAPLAQRVA